MALPAEVSHDRDGQELPKPTAPETATPASISNAEAISRSDGAQVGGLVHQLRPGGHLAKVFFQTQGRAGSQGTA